MKGYLLSYYFTNQKSIYIYLLLSIPICLFFSFTNPIMASFMPMIFLVSPATDNLKNEKDSKWMYFVSTLPYSRNTYVSSHFAFYSLLALTGMVVSLVINAIVAGSIVSGVNSALLGTGFIALYSLIFPFTFKMGAEKSNVIFMIVSIIVVILFFVYYFVGMAILSGTGNFIEEISENLWYGGIFALIGLIVMVLSFIASKQAFKYKEL
ncbi:ABC-2 transporter permease [Staphylococcus cohnii]|uniref:ABC-2 transporter permease n=1 Tax=Staphylococcus cohnii TaxID=29382 RepID=UPI000D1C81D7|nr:ABC-2 transporter permease [Staphylococcus cohnii]PTF24825.1 ABC-2 transporter permease [Staphylococcus cohnii]PTF29183.1 ABC-2 transporter permease [Staphylococcus cohnii]RIL85610.1 ABC-2 transporter permease [Staphylococcus cohnii]